MITSKTINTEYEAEAGLEYELGVGCKRVLLEPFYETVLEFDKLAAQEGGIADPGSDTYSPLVHLKMVELVTEGDAIPKGYKGMNTKVAGGIVRDFLLSRGVAMRQPTN